MSKNQLEIKITDLWQKINNILLFVFGKISEFERTIFKNKYFFAGFLTLSLIFILIFQAIINPQIKNLEVIQSSENITDQSTPIKQSFPVFGENDNKSLDQIDITLEIDYKIWNFKKIRLFADDCITSVIINAQDISTENGFKCNDEKGFEIDLSSNLKYGTNLVEVGLKDTGGKYFLQSTYSFGDPLFIISLLLFFAWILLLVWFILYTNKISRWILGFFVLNFFVIGSYLSQNNFNVRVLDVLEGGGQLDYILYIFKNGSLPNPNSPSNAWAYFHPPFYYATGSIVLFMSKILGFIDFLFWLQFLSLLYYIGFLVFSVLTLKFYFKQNYKLFLASLSILFWPAGILHSIRIGNDPILYFLFSACIYFVHSWWYKLDLNKEKTSNKSLYLSMFFASLAVITKSNGLILYPVLALIIFANLIKNKNFKKFLQIGLIGFLILFPALLLNFGRNYAANINETNFLSRISATQSSVNSRLEVKNNLTNFLYFDTESYFKEPFVTPWNDKFGRQYFIQYLIKTASFSEFSFKEELRINISILMSAIILLIFLISFARILSLQKEDFSQNVIIFIYFWVSITALITYRLAQNYASNNDFRYIYFLVLPLTVFFIQSLDKFFYKQTLLRLIIISLPVLMCFLSVFFFLNL